MCAGAHKLLSVGAAHSAVPSDAGIRAVSRLAVRQQAFWRQHGRHHGCCQTQLTGTLPRDSREGSLDTTNIDVAGRFEVRPGATVYARQSAGPPVRGSRVRVRVRVNYSSEVVGCGGGVWGGGAAPSPVKKYF